MGQNSKQNHLNEVSKKENLEKRKKDMWVDNWYYVYIQSCELGNTSHQNRYDNDEKNDEINLWGCPYSGKIIIRINGSPIEIFIAGYYLTYIDELIQEGENEIVLENSPQEGRIFLKVLKYKQPPRTITELTDGPFTVLAKDWFPADSDKLTLKIQAEEPYSKVGPLFQSMDILEDTPEAREKQSEEVREVMRQMLTALREHDPWKSHMIATKMSREEVEPFVDPITASPLVEWPDDSFLDDIKMVFGHKTILVYYDGKPENEFLKLMRTPYLFIGKNTGDIVVQNAYVFFSPGYFFRTDGVWRFNSQ